MDKRDLNTILLSAVLDYPPGADHITSINEFYDRGIAEILTNQFSKTRDVSDKLSMNHKTIRYSISFKDVQLGRPMKDATRPMYPMDARAQNRDYMGDLKITMVFVVEALNATGDVVKSFTKTMKNINIGGVPIFVRSNKCWLHDIVGLDMYESHHEDPRDNGGYMIMGGGEWAAIMNENLLPNDTHIFFSSNVKKRIEAKFQSKPGDHYENSYMLSFNYYTTGALRVELATGIGAANVEMSYHVLMQALGVTQYREMTQYVVDHDLHDDINNDIRTIVVDSYTEGFDNQTQALLHIDELLNTFRADVPDVVKINSVQRKLDREILPHLGQAPNDRISKAKYIGFIFRKMLLTHERIIEPTDRDSYKNKRIHPAGINMAKTLKQGVNLIIMNKFSLKIPEYIRKKTSFAELESQWESFIGSLVETLGTQGLGKYFNRQVKSASDQVSHQSGQVQTANRLTTQQMDHKNLTSVRYVQTAIVTPSVSSAKADTKSQNVRKVQQSTIGYLCYIYTTDTGPKIGVNKQKACTARITTGGIGEVLVQHLIKDPLMATVIYGGNSVKDMLTETADAGYRIFVNGKWVGESTRWPELVTKYRLMRRNAEIDIHTTVYVAERVPEIHFWSDFGRIVRPLLIVHNNHDEYMTAYKQRKPIQFKQWISITPKIIRDLATGKMKFDQLIEEKHMEYISAEEQGNCVLAENLDVLVEHANDITHMFTHCDIEQATLGDVALNCAYLNNVPSARTLMYGNHKKQACDVFAGNYPHLMVKKLGVQYYSDNPLTGTIANVMMPPAVQNVMIAYAAIDGAGQEDSIIVNRSSIGRGLYNLDHYTFVSMKITSAKRGIPADNQIVGRSPNVIVEGLDEKFVIKPGTIVRQNQVLVSQFSEIVSTNSDDIVRFKDQSLYWTNSEPGIIVAIVYDQARLHIKVRSSRPMMIGDKVSSGSGCKGINALMLDQSDMPFMEDGSVPDIIINPQSINSRMVIGQLIETMMGIRACHEGTRYAADPFQPMNLEEMSAALEKDYGIKDSGHRQMFNGHTGFWIDTKIFIGSTPYQRLAKFVIDNVYGVFDSVYNAITRQPIHGRSRNGGLKIGEMERDVITISGSIRVMRTKMQDNSDGVVWPVCATCGRFAIVNESIGMYRCITCGSKADIKSVRGSHTANVFLKELQAIGVHVRMHLEHE